MRNLIFADIKRILRKPTHRIILLASLLISLVSAVYTRVQVWNGFTFAQGQTGIFNNIIGVILGVVIFVNVYADEFTSNSMQCLIGRGISRLRLLLARFADGFIITAVTFGIYALFVFLLALLLGAGMNSGETVLVFGSILIGAVKTIGFAAISMIILYWTQSAVWATLVDIVLFVALGDLLSTFFDALPVIRYLHLENRLFDRVLDRMILSMELGESTVFLTILGEIIKVSVVSIFLSYLLFRKKELDF